MIGPRSQPRSIPLAATAMREIVWRAEYLSNHDGDTVTVLAKGPWFGRQEIVVRVLGIQAAEVAPRAKTPEEAEAGARVRDFLTAVLMDAKTRMLPILLRTEKPDAYQLRFDGDIWIDGMGVGSLLLTRFEATGEVCRYGGQGKAPAFPFLPPKK